MFQQCGALDLLHGLYDGVLVSEQVALEFKATLPQWISVRKASNEGKVRELRERLDMGEASAIALAVELGGCLLVLDDKKARAVAAEEGLWTTSEASVWSERRNKRVSSPQWNRC